jgi:hypothetical protein
MIFDRTVDDTAPVRGLQWCAQFAPEPAFRFSRLHRIREIDDALVNKVAGGVFESSDIETRGTGGDTCQRG